MTHPPYSPKSIGIDTKIYSIAHYSSNRPFKGNYISDVPPALVKM